MYQGNGSFLPDELWAAIFGFIDNKEEWQLDLGVTLEEQREASQASLFTLRLVCKWFNKAIARYKSASWGSDHLFLRPDLSEAHLPSLLAWAHKRAFQRVHAYCNCQYSEVMLDKLSFADHVLDLDVSAVSAPILSIISTFENLIYCWLKPKQTDMATDLSPLLLLVDLQILCLESGDFGHFHLPPSLHVLRLREAELHVAQNSSCTWPTQLHRLVLTASGLLHGLRQMPGSVSAFLCADAVINSTVDGDVFTALYHEPFVVLPTISQALTGLTELDLRLGPSQGEHASALTWVYTLTSLCRLTLAFKQDCSIGNLTKLSRLQELNMFAHRGNKDYVVDLEANWSALQNLHSLSLHDGTFNFRTDILGLTTL